MADYKNIITNGFSKYISYLVQGNSSDLYFSVGTGKSSWDSSDELPNPDLTTSNLVNEVYRKLIDSDQIKYVDPETLEESEEPTSVLRLCTKLTNNEYYGTIREYGVYAIDATDQLGTGTLICYCCHKSMKVPTDSTFEKYIYINT